jgi:hypothetical protein
MRIKGVLLTALAAGLLTVAFAGPARAQVVVAAPTVSYYYAAPAVYSAPVVSYYQPAAPVVYYQQAAPVVAAPAVSYYYAPTVSYPATVSRGLFGRTIVRTPFYKIKY